MDVHELALVLMAAQGVMGAFDTLYHHELTEALARRPSARLELGIHATRALIYGALFIGLSAWAWQGAWAWLLIVLFGVEVALTLWDFVVEDRTRLLPATERVTHTLLAINGGAFVMLLLLTARDWLALPTAMAWQPRGLLSVFLMLCGVGVAASGVRDALALRALGRRAAREQALPPVRFEATARRVLVTGGTGFIGQALVTALLADGHEVTVLTRDPRRAAWTFGGRVRCIEHMQQLGDGERVDVIINLAGERIVGPRWSARRQAALRASRLDLTRSVVEWIQRAQVKPALLLSASAIGYYGVQAQGDDASLAESAPSQAIFMSTLCRDWEAEARRAEALGVRVACLRLGLVLGHGGSLPLMLLPFQLGLGGRLGSGRQWLSWVHVQDVLRAIGHVWRLSLTDAGTPRATVFNVVAPDAVRQADFARIAAGVLRRPCLVPTPAAPLRLLLGEQADLLLEGQRVVPAALQANGFRFAYPDLRTALTELCRFEAAAPRPEADAQTISSAGGRPTPREQE